MNGDKARLRRLFGFFFFLSQYCNALLSSKRARRADARVNVPIPPVLRISYIRPPTHSSPRGRRASPLELLREPRESRNQVSRELEREDAIGQSRRVSRNGTNRIAAKIN